MKKLIAHRGKYNKIIGENTYLSMIYAFNDPNYVGVEFDVRLTKDKQLVVIHDSFINRTSNGNGCVSEMTLNELKKYNFGSKNFYQTIPTLEQILNIESKKIYLIELKCNNNEKEMVKYLLKVLEKYKHLNIYICSFNKKVLKFLKKSDFKIGKLIFTSWFIRGVYEFWGLYKLSYNANVLKKIKKMNKELFIWTVDSHAELEKFDGDYFIIYNEKAN